MSARRLSAAPVGLLLVCIGLGGVAACSDPDPAAVVAPVQAPLPPYPAWANSLIGQNMSHVLTGRGVCVGVWDVVVAKHVGTRSGDEGEGWGWDVTAKTPIHHVLFVNADNFIVGAGDGGRPRADVSKSREDVTSANTGWHGIIGVTKGKILAVGVTAKNAACNVGAYDLSSTTNS